MFRFGKEDETGEYIVNYVVCICMRPVQSLCGRRIVREASRNQASENQWYKMENKMEEPAADLYRVGPVLRNFHGWTGEFIYPSPPPNSPPWRRKATRKKQKKARLKSFRKYFSQLFAKVNIQITIGHGRSNLAKSNIFPETCNYLRNY